ncbi:uncharacterized protein LOC125682259 [Ostrea edulis]|uniref:uncharacterized protein LOC125682259 n=1 Tax=Ostrea edulis TaxID=37623 RepID=UPI0024AF3C08|nr:uncharacterized protein LOC125682259 [Ostrea edulis]
MCVILHRLGLILAVCQVIEVYTASSAPRFSLHLQPAKSIDAEPGPNILRTEGINVLKGYIKNTNDKMDNTKETNEELIPFCIFCLQPSYKDSTDCKKHCTNLDVKQGKISTREKKIIGPLREIISPQRKLIRTKDLKVKDDIFEGTGNKGIVVITDALCAFCRLYPVYQQTDFCQQKLCSSAS